MSARKVDVDGSPWLDGWVGVDADGRLWRLRFVQSTWGPARDRWVWQTFGVELDYDLDSEVVARPLTKIWPPEPAVEDETPKPKRRAS